MVSSVPPSCPSFLSFLCLPSLSLPLSLLPPLPSSTIRKTMFCEHLITLYLKLNCFFTAHSQPAVRRIIASPSVQSEKPSVQINVVLLFSMKISKIFHTLNTFHIHQAKWAGLTWIPVPYTCIHSWAIGMSLHWKFSQFKPDHRACCKSNVYSHLSLNVQSR